MSDPYLFEVEWCLRRGMVTVGEMNNATLIPVESILLTIMNGLSKGYWRLELNEDDEKS